MPKQTKRPAYDFLKSVFNQRNACITISGRSARRTSFATTNAHLQSIINDNANEARCIAFIKNNTIALAAYKTGNNAKNLDKINQLIQNAQTNG